MRHLLNWALSALALWIVARLVPGFHVDGPLAALVAALLRACPDLHILATSREALRLVGERRYRVPTLTAPPANLK